MESLGYPGRFCSVGTSVAATWTFHTGCVYDWMLPYSGCHNETDRSGQAIIRTEATAVLTQYSGTVLFVW